jgi:hypothetical protein
MWFGARKIMAKSALFQVQNVGALKSAKDKYRRLVSGICPAWVFTADKLTAFNGQSIAQNEALAEATIYFRDMKTEREQQRVAKQVYYLALRSAADGKLLRRVKFQRDLDQAADAQVGQRVQMMVRAQQERTRRPLFHSALVSKDLQQGMYFEVEARRWLVRKTPIYRVCCCFDFFLNQ